MKLLIVDIAASSGGAISVLKDFYEEIKDDKENEYIFLLSDNYLKETSNIKIKVLSKEKKWLNRLIFDHFKGKKIVKELNPDVILSFQNTIIRKTNKPTVLYLHQSIPFQKIKKFSFFKKNEFKLAVIQYLIGKEIKDSIKLSDKVIVQSNWIKTAVSKMCKVPEGKIIKISPNINFHFSLLKTDINYNNFFYPTSNEIYKNIDLIYKSIDILKEKNISKFKVNLTIDGENNNFLNYIGKISRDDVFRYYQNSILIFSSYIESYPLPLIEAKKTNTIILASDTPFSREILSDYENAYFFNPFNPQELADLMEKCIKRKIIKKANIINDKIEKKVTIMDIVKEANRKRVLWLTNVPSPYRVNFFNEFGKLVDLTVLFERNASSERDESWKKFEFTNFVGIILNGIKFSVDKSVNPFVVFKIKKNKYAYYFISNYSSPTGVIAALYMILRKINYVIETDGGFAKNGKGIKELLKKIIISHAYLCFSTSEEGDNYYRTYNAKNKNIIRYPFTSLYDRDILKCVISKNEKNKIKKELKITEEKIILSIGRFIPIKGFDILLRSCKNIGDNVGIYIIGGTKNDEYDKIIKNYKIKNVHFIDFLLKDELNKYYRCADLFVFATRGDVWGLVINEALANGLPVITTNKCIAGLELIKNNKNGYIVESENVDELEEKIISLIKDDKKRALMSKEALTKIADYTFENMSKVHYEKLIKYERQKI